MGLQGLGGAKDGQTVARYDYDAFGNRITNTAPELGEDVCPFGFSTKLTDGETGLVYYGYRYYSPEMGRWVSRDPIGERGGINLYGMVGNDAVNMVDIVGLTKREDIDAGRLIYTLNGGWIDWGHANPSGPKALWTSIDGEDGHGSVRDPAGYVLSYRQSMSKSFISVGDGGLYWIKYGLGRSNKESVALGIFKEVTEKFEGMQASFPYNLVTDSGNLEEDRPSNVVAFYRAVKGFDRSQIEAWLKPQTKENSKCLWDKIGGLKHSKSWSPTDYNKQFSEVIGRDVGPLQWPSQLSTIREVPKGSIWKGADIDHFPDPLLGP